MKKILLLSFLLLCGCTRTIDLDRRAAESAEEAQNTVIYDANISKPYYSFYLEPSIGRISADYTSDILNVDGTKLVMNLNVPEIVNANFFTEVPVSAARISKDPVLKLDGTFSDLQGTEQTWKLSVYDVEDNSYAFVFSTYAATFYSVCSAAAVPDLLYHAITISRSVEIDTENVLDAFTTEDTVVFTSSTIKLFESVAPVNGAIEELFETDNTLGYGENENGDNGQTQIDGDEVEDEGFTN